MNIVRVHDGERFVTALEVRTGHKHRHLVVLASSGVRALAVPLGEPVEVLGPVKKKHLAILRRAGKTFGITKAALDGLEAAASD